MDYKQPPRSPEEPATYIENPKLAEDMAYAEKQYRNAIVVLKKELGDIASTEVLTVLETSANNASHEVGLAHIATEQAKLDTLRHQLGSEVTDEPNTVETESPLETEAKKIGDALFKQYEKYGVKREDFELVGDTVMYTAVNGIDLGDPKKDEDPARNWQSIQKDPKDSRFVMEINGRSVDTRRGMTEKLYRAWIDKLIELKKTDDTVVLPDNYNDKETWVKFGNGNSYPSWTLLTGDEAGGAIVPIARVYDGSVLRGGAYRGSDYRNFRFRPAVKVTTPDLR